MTLETFIEKLYEAGWKAPNDAQHENIAKVWEQMRKDIVKEFAVWLFPEEK